jgi:hypothetical protein
MARLPFDSDWAAFTRRLATVDLPPLDPAGELKLAALLENRHLQRRVSIRRGYNASFWEVRLYLCKSQRLFASIRVAAPVFAKDREGGNIALRVADAVLLYFHSYRQDWAHTPAAHEFNFSEAQAHSDLDHSADLRGIFEEMESHLQSLGSLPTLDELSLQHAEETRKETRAPQTVRRTSAEVAELREQLGKQTALYSDLQSQISALRTANRDLAAEVAHHATQLECIRRGRNDVLPQQPVFVPMPGQPLTDPNCVPITPTAPPYTVTCDAGETKKDVVTNTPTC